MGVQLTFLDTASDNTEEKDVEVKQSGFKVEEMRYEPVADKKEMTIAQISEQNIEEEPENEPEIELAKDLEEQQAQVSDAEAEESVDETDGESVETLTEEELTPIEAAAAEEAENADDEAKLEEETDVVVEEFDEDIWDEKDRKLWIAKKRYADYCASLVVPPLKVSKDTPMTARKSNEKPRTSGYRYEMTERLPVFADGINGGKNTDSYFKREMEYCEDREAKRSKQLLDKLRATWRKTVFALVVMLSVIVLENINVFMGSAPDKLLTSDNVLIFSIIDIALLAIGAIFIFDAIKDGLKFAAKGVFIPETLTAGVVILSVIYHVVLIFAGGSEYAILFGTPAAIAIFLCALYRYHMLKREYVAFSVTSSYGSYLTEVKMLGFRSSPEGKA